MKVSTRVTVIIAAVALVTALCSASQAAEPKNAILFIGDGMGPAQVTAGRIFKENAKDGQLTLDTLEHVAIVRTYAAYTLVTDSAAAGTAMAAGHKTNAGMVGQTPDGTKVESILQKAKKAGKSVGIVTSTGVTHATPASFYAHTPYRNLEADIAGQLIDYDQVDVVMGGGREFFIPQGEKDSESGDESGRRDDRNLLKEAEENGYRVIMKEAGFRALKIDVEKGEDPGKVLALFEDGHMTYEVERENDAWGEPSLAEMTEVAIKILSRNPNGYFLMVEGGRIDHAGHGNQGLKVVTEMVEFDESVKAGLDATNNAEETLIVITADHETGGLAINGYAPLEVGGMDLLTTEPIQSGAKTILSFASGPGADRSQALTTPPDDPGYRQPALYEAGSAAHTGVDVLLWAAGPGAEEFGGTLDNTEVATKIMAALGLD